MNWDLLPKDSCVEKIFRALLEAPEPRIEHFFDDWFRIHCSPQFEHVKIDRAIENNCADLEARVNKMVAEGVLTQCNYN